MAVQDGEVHARLVERLLDRLLGRVVDHPGDRGMVDAREDELAYAGVPGGLDHRGAHARLVGGEGRVDVEDALCALCCGAQAGGVPEVADDRLVGAGPTREVGPALVAHQPPHGDAALLHLGYYQTGVPAGRPYR